MGERVTKRTVQLDPTVIVGQLEAVLTLLAKPTRLTVAIAPGDETLAREAMPDLMAKFSAAQHIDLIVDQAMQPGSCIARTAAGGTFDASIPAQLDRMVAALMPGPGTQLPSDSPAGPMPTPPASPDATPPSTPPGEPAP
jgi:flagellar biosynthesis/type III secretory pathway protein FliH